MSNVIICNLIGLLSKGSVLILDHVYVRRDHGPRTDDTDDSEICPLLYSLLQVFSKSILFIVIVTENQISPEWRYDSDAHEDNIFEKLLCEKKITDLNLESIAETISLLTLSPFKNGIKNRGAFLLHKDSSISHINKDLLLTEGKSLINVLKILPLKSTDIERSLIKKFIENNKKNNIKDHEVKYSKKKNENKCGDNDNDNESHIETENNEWSFTEENLKKEIFVSELSQGYIGLIKIFSGLDFNILENLISNAPKERGARVEGIENRFHLIYPLISIVLILSYWFLALN